MRTHKVLLSCGLAFGIAAGVTVFAFGGLARASIASEPNQCGTSAACQTTILCVQNQNAGTINVGSGNHISGSDQCGSMQGSTGIDNCGGLLNEGVSGNCP